MSIICLVAGDGNIMENIQYQRCMIISHHTQYDVIRTIAYIYIYIFIYIYICMRDNFLYGNCDSLTLYARNVI